MRTAPAARHEKRDDRRAPRAPREVAARRTGSEAERASARAGAAWGRGRAAATAATNTTRPGRRAGRRRFRRPARRQASVSPRAAEYDCGQRTERERIDDRERDAEGGSGCGGRHEHDRGAGRQEDGEAGRPARERRVVEHRACAVPGGARPGCERRPHRPASTTPSTATAAASVPSSRRSCHLLPPSQPSLRALAWASRRPAATARTTKPSSAPRPPRRAAAAVAAPPGRGCLRDLLDGPPGRPRPRGQGPTGPGRFSPRRPRSRMDARAVSGGNQL
jgi:hypothetical protein